MYKFTEGMKMMELLQCGPACIPRQVPLHEWSCPHETCLLILIFYIHNKVWHKDCNSRYQHLFRNFTWTGS